jgi:hypothetical protein
VKKKVVYILPAPQISITRMLYTSSLPVFILPLTCSTLKQCLFFQNKKWQVYSTDVGASEGSTLNRFNANICSFEIFVTTSSLGT